MFNKYFNAHTVIKNVIKNNTLGKLLRITGLRNTNYFENRPEWFENGLEFQALSS